MIPCITVAVLGLIQQMVCGCGLFNFNFIAW